MKLSSLAAWSSIDLTISCVFFWSSFKVVFKPLIVVPSTFSSTSSWVKYSSLIAFLKYFSSLVTIFENVLLLYSGNLLTSILSQSISLVKSYITVLENKSDLTNNCLFFNNALIVPILSVFSRSSKSKLADKVCKSILEL